MEKYLVVYESLWNNKYSYKTNKVGTTIKEIIDGYDLIFSEDVEFDEEDIAKLDDYPFVAGTMGPGFYDMDVYSKEMEEVQTEPDWNGKIMVFFIGEDIDPVLEKRLTIMRDRFVKVDEFARRFPIFKDYIIEHEEYEGIKLSKLGYNYKSLYFNTAMFRVFYDIKNPIPNWDGEYKGDTPEKYLFVIRFDTDTFLSLTESILKKLTEENIYFYDEKYRTFYIEDENVETFLESANKYFEEM